MRGVEEETVRTVPIVPTGRAGIAMEAEAGATETGESAEVRAADKAGAGIEARNFHVATPRVSTKGNQI
jgi:hypothetical protein